MNRRQFVAGGTIAAIGTGSGYLVGSQDATNERSVIRRALHATAAVTVLGVETARRDSDKLSTPLIRRSYGSAVFIDRDGLALTNSHVVSGGLDIALLDAHQRQWRAEVVADDPMTDLALIKVDAEAPAILRLNEAPLPSGAPVVAIGAPYEYFSSVSDGIVSGVRRARRKSAPGIFFQHTAMINPGSSGGPVIDGQGHLVGINTAIPDSQFEFAGISLAVESRILSEWLSRFNETGSFYRAAYGLSLHVSEFGAAGKDGEVYSEAVMVQSVVQGGPMDRSGLRAGDQIVSFKGRPVLTQSGLLSSLLLAEPGLAQTIVLCRAGRMISSAVVPDRLVCALEKRGSWTAGHGFTLSSESLPIVASVVPGSPAEFAGLKAGDRIFAIGEESVDTSEQAESALGKYPLVVPMAVSRNGEDIRWINLGAADTGGVIAGNNLGVGSFSI